MTGNLFCGNSWGRHKVNFVDGLNILRGQVNRREELVDFLDDGLRDVAVLPVDEQETPAQWNHRPIFNRRERGEGDGRRGCLFAFPRGCFFKRRQVFQALAVKLLANLPEGNALRLVNPDGDELQPVLVIEGFGITAQRRIQQAQGAVVADRALADFVGCLPVGGGDTVLLAPGLDGFGQFFNSEFAHDNPTIQYDSVTVKCDFDAFIAGRAAEFDCIITASGLRRI